MSTNNGGVHSITGNQIAFDHTEGLMPPAPTNLGNIWRSHFLPPRQQASVPTSPRSNTQLLTSHDYHTYHAPIGSIGG